MNCEICNQPGTLHEGHVLCPSCRAKIEQHEAKLQARLARLQQTATKAQREAEAEIGKARQMAQAIPFGQPILVGHHSEQRDRNYRARIERTFERGFEKYKRAEALRARANNAANNRAIASDDPAALLKLRAQLEAAEADQARMKTANAAIRKALKLPEGERVPAVMQALGVNEARAATLLQPDFMGRVGYPSYATQNNSATIRRLKDRIAAIEKLEAQRAAQPEPTQQEVAGVVVERDLEAVRLRLRFPGKPAPAIIKALKSYGFRWAPSEGAWQRQLTNAAEYAAKQVLIAYQEEVA